MTTSVFRPVRLPGNYINVRLVGRESNRDAIGARIKLTAGGKEQHSLVSGGSGFGCLPYEQHFGLGKFNLVDSLSIRWPNGRQQQWDRLPVNCTLRLVEGETGWRSVYAGREESVTSRDNS